MRSKRTQRLFLLALFGMAIVALGVIVGLFRTGVTLRNFERVQPGMTLAEVSDLFGKPPVGTEATPYTGHYDWRESGAVVTHIWYGEKLTAQVGFDEAGVVVWKQECPPAIPWKEWARPSLWQQIRSRIGL